MHAGQSNCKQRGGAVEESVDSLESLLEIRSRLHVAVSDRNLHRHNQSQESLSFLRIASISSSVVLFCSRQIRS